METRIVVMMAAMLFAGGLRVAAQGANAEKAAGLTVVIRVVDPSGAVVPGAKVRVAPAAENASEAMETNSKGELRLKLKAGRYGLAVSDAGFTNYLSSLEVAANNEGRIVHVILQIGRMGGPVIVDVAPEKGMLMLKVSPFPDAFRITAVDLKGMARKTVVAHNPHANADEKYEGVLLADLLAKYGAPLGKDLRGPALACYVVATGSDGYKAVFSLAEIDPSFHPGDVIVADTMDGKPLDEHSGPFRLVSTEDKRPARGVRNLVSLEVKE